MAEVAVSRTVEFEIVSPDGWSLELAAKTGSRSLSAFGGLPAVNRLRQPRTEARFVGAIDMTPVPFDTHVLLHTSGAISVLALAFRDQVKLRFALLLSIFVAFIYHLSPVPDLNEILWDIVSSLIDIIVLIQIIMDRTNIGFSGDEEELFAALGSLTPGTFRSLVKLGAWKTATSETVITTQGVVPRHIYYVLKGGIEVKKDERKIMVPPRTFIGEVAFLHNTPASATVSLEPGSLYLEWPVAALQKRMESRESLKTSVLGVIGLDMALKVARG